MIQILIKFIIKCLNKINIYQFIHQFKNLKLRTQKYLNE